MTLQNFQPIHAVITWVDGNDPDHQKLRAQYQTLHDKPLSENASNPHRWADNDEIIYCLRSIENHAPWIETIWIVTSGQEPDLSALSEPLRKKIKMVFHTEIFEGFEHCLPTFNSLAIETMLWRIDGLSEHFIYFNDDVFISAPLKERDIFIENRPVLRGYWSDLTGFSLGGIHHDDPVYFNHFMQRHAAEILGFDPDKIFYAAHVAHPMLKSVMSTLFDQHRTHFEKNISHRFRDIEQFLPQGLHNHFCIKSGVAELQTSKDHFHVHTGFGSKMSDDTLAQALEDGLTKNTNFLCINDLPQLEARKPDIRQWVETAISNQKPRD